MAKDDIPNISPALGLLHDPASQVGKWKKTTDVAEECLKLIILIFSNSIIDTLRIPSKVCLQNWLKILVFPEKAVEQEPVLRERIMGLVLGEGRGGATLRFIDAIVKGF